MAAEEENVQEVAEKLKEVEITEGGEPTPEGEKTVETVYQDPTHFSVKHPLQHSWTLWYDNPGKKTNQNNWSASLKQVYTFSFVEDFWALFNTIKPASKLTQGSNYHLFKEGIEPKWEDPANTEGGKWVITLPRQKRERLDDFWTWTVLGVIGENFPNSDEVCGAVVSARKQNDRIGLWTAHATNAEDTKAIGRTLKDMLEVTDKLDYQVHSDSIKKDRSFSNKARYSV